MRTPKQLLLSIATVVMSLTIINCGGSSGGGGSSSPAPATALGQSCGANMIQSQYGCLQQCGVSSVIYQGQCVQVSNTGYGNGYGTGYGTGGYGTGYGGNVQMCQGTCPAGLVSFQNGTACMPQGSCGACYAQMGQMCYIGDYAHQYYGY